MIGEPDISVVSHRDIIGIEIGGDHLALAGGDVPGGDATVAVAGGVEPAVRTKGHAVGPAGVFSEGGHLAIGTDAVDFLLAGIGEEHLAIGGGIRALGESMAFAD